MYIYVCGQYRDESGDEQRGAGHGGVQHLKGEGVRLVAQWETLHDGAGEVLQRARNAGAAQGREAAVQLGVRLVQQREREVVADAGARAEHAPAAHRQPVVDRHLAPWSENPESKPKHWVFTW